MNFTLRTSTQVLSALVLALTMLSAIAPPVTAQRTEAKTVTVFAAASLKTALDAISPGFEQATGHKLSISYAASSALAKQIEQGAPADIFISADLDWMDYLSSKSLINPATRTNLLGNRLVLIAPAASTATISITKGFALAAVIGDGKIAMADVKAVPAGKYGKAALEALGVWPSVESKVAQTENVRAALALVARAEAPAGIVYQTDAAADTKVKILGFFPEDTHPPIIYPIAAIKDSKNQDAGNALLTYLSTPPAKERFVKEGFTVLR